MTEAAEKRKIKIKDWFLLCPFRHVLCALGLILIGAYFALRDNTRLMEALGSGFVRLWHRFYSGLFDFLPLSMAEVLIVAGVLAALVYIIFTAVQLIRKGEKLKRLYHLAMTVLAAFSAIYGGFCLLWGVYYYAPDFETQSGLLSQPISTEQLETVTRYFTGLANEYGKQVKRDENGVFCEPTEDIFAYAPGLYDAVEELFPCLEAAARHAKPFYFSRIMSYIGFTGFFFPFTGEANINTDSPACFIPSTIAHEFAHQRGVAAEDEANFVAVLACLSDGDPVYCYSASLLAYVYLSNALYKADYEAWAENYTRLSASVRADLAENNAYWKQFETPVGDASDAVYTGFLQSYGQELGLQTYGACVDLLVAYYYDIASNTAS